MYRINCLLKYLLSFFKPAWEIGDYPIRIKHYAGLDVQGRFTSIPWSAQIVNWWAMIGMGDTKEEALLKLEENFEQYTSSGKKLPRPGVKVPIQFAPTTEIEQYEALAVDFFKKILGKEYYNCFISDLSSLWDFAMEGTIGTYQRKIALVYRVDVSDIESGNLVEILKRISMRRT
ncbi:MAG: hypothetical protein JXA42_15940 [Anaerolineales bacterium]|nr:hypothetical protein [Anaerolineales bacterium]